MIKKESVIYMKEYKMISETSKLSAHVLKMFISLKHVAKSTGEILTLLTSGGMFPLCVSFRYLSVLKIKRCPDQASFQSPRQRRIRVTPRDLSVLLPLVFLHSIFHHFPIVHFPLVSSISIRLQ